jgi:cysteine desulfuration protein SufE
MSLKSLEDVYTEWDALGDLYEDPYDERMRLLVQLGRTLEPMPDALKTEATRVLGCATPVWVYALPSSSREKLHFLADGASGPGLTKGIIALILLAVQDRSADEIVRMDLPALLKPFDIEKQFTSNRTSGVANMIKKVQETAARLAE